MKSMSFMPPQRIKKSQTAAELRDKIVKFLIEFGKFKEPPEKLSKALLRQAICSVEGVKDSCSVKSRIDWLLSSGVIKHGDWSKDDFIIIYDASPPPAAPMPQQQQMPVQQQKEFDEIMEKFR
jgi:hypothetical protein